MGPSGVDQVCQSIWVSVLSIGFQRAAESRSSQTDGNITVFAQTLQTFSSSKTEEIELAVSVSTWLNALSGGRFGEKHQLNDSKARYVAELSPRLYRQNDTVNSVVLLLSVSFVSSVFIY